MQRSYQDLLGRFPDAAPRFALVDGNKLPGLSIPAQAIIGGDGKSACIGTASIIAKVSRDHKMLELDEQYPQYGFAKHKGYGTKLHYQALEEHGVLPIHRRSFLKKWKGDQGE